MREVMKSVIAETFSKLLETENLDKITVTKLITECHISRQTFYYHFRDVMDVLEWNLRCGTKEMIQESLKEKDPVSALTTYVTFTHQNRKKLQKLLRSRHRAQIEELLIGSVTAYLAGMAQGSGQGTDLNIDDMEVMLRFYACGIVGVLLQYVEKPKRNEGKLVRQLGRILSGELFPGKRSIVYAPRQK